MHQTKKGNKWSFGMKVHIGADEETGVVHRMTSANVHDVTETSPSPAGRGPNDGVVHAMVCALAELGAHV